MPKHNIICIYIVYASRKGSAFHVADGCTCARSVGWVALRFSRCGVVQRDRNRTHATLRSMSAWLCADPICRHLPVCGLIWVLAASHAAAAYVSLEVWSNCTASAFCGSQPLSVAPSNVKCQSNLVIKSCLVSMGTLQCSRIAWALKVVGLCCRWAKSER